MCGLDPHDQPLLPQRHLGGWLGLHVVDVLLHGHAAHSVSDDVQEHEHACSGSIDDPCLEILEVAPAGAAGVGHGRHARAKCEAVGIDAVIARVRPSLPRPGVNVHVNIDEPRRDV